MTVIASIIEGRWGWRGAWQTSRAGRIELAIALTLLVLEVLIFLNPQYTWGDPFSPSIPREEWFLHLYQWGPDGCGTELCR